MLNYFILKLLLVRANLSEDPKTKLSEKELMAQLQSVSTFLCQRMNPYVIRTLMVAGQETTASTLTWAFYELSRHPEVQARVREEIRATRAEATQRGHGELTVTDLDSMDNLLAVIKVFVLCKEWRLR